jgi:hypothetical protein
MKKYFVTFIIVVFAAFALYNSLYFEKLDQRKLQEMKKNFNPKEAVDFFWKNKLDDILKYAVNLKLFDSLLVADPQYLIQQSGLTVGISSDYSFIVSGITVTKGKDAEEIPAVLPDGNFKYNLILKYIFGNAARNAVGYFKVNDFENTMDFNAVATELNSVILKNVINEKFNSLPSGTRVKFFGAVEMNPENILNEFNIIPLRFEIIK